MALWPACFNKQQIHDNSNNNNNKQEKRKDRPLLTSCSSFTVQTTENTVRVLHTLLPAPVLLPPTPSRSRAAKKTKNIGRTGFSSTNSIRATIISIIALGWQQETSRKNDYDSHCPTKGNNGSAFFMDHPPDKNTTHHHPPRDHVDRQNLKKNKKKVVIALVQLVERSVSRSTGLFIDWSVCWLTNPSLSWLLGGWVGDVPNASKSDPGWAE